MNRGYIKIWRKIEDSGLLQMHGTLALFIYMVMQASHKDTKVGTPSGVVNLSRGQFISGRHKLSAAVGLSEQSIRTALSNLQKLKILTSTATNHYTIYTIENYGQYQDSCDATNQQNNQQVTNNQPTGNQQVTTKQEFKNLSIKENKHTNAPSDKSLNAIEFDFSKGQFTNISGQIEIWKKAYPAVYVEAEVNKAAAWLVANPKNRKSNYARFLNNWLSKAQDKAPASHSRVPALENFESKDYGSEITLL